MLDKNQVGTIPNTDRYAVVLDDDPVIARLIEGIIGIKVFAFSSISSFKDSFETLTPTAVFVDIHLTDGESGLETVPHIKQRWPSSPVIVITGDQSDAVVGQALAFGADDFIQKPIRPGELVARYLARKAEIELRNNFTILHFADIELNLSFKCLTGPKGKYFQSPREVEILAHLIRANGTVTDKNNLKRGVWGDISVSDNALDRKLFEVRKAIKSVSDSVEIRSIYSHGIELRLKSSSATLNNIAAYRTVGSSSQAQRREEIIG